MSALHPVNRRDSNYRVSKYKKYESELNFTGIDFPVALKDLAEFEQQNNISVNVYGLTRKKKWKFNTVPLHLTSQKREIHVNLLRVEDYYLNEYDNLDDYDDDEGNEPLNFHYVWIKNLSRLVNNQFSSNRHKKHICDRCSHYFTSEIKLINHETDCKKMNRCKIILPEEGQNIVEFKNCNNKEKVPFVIYADYECFLRPVNESQERNSNTEVFERHELFDIGYYLKCSYDESLSGYHSCPSYRQVSQISARRV